MKNLVKKKKLIRKICAPLKKKKMCEHSNSLYIPGVLPEPGFAAVE